jgi:hypothetical protein
MRAEKSEDGSEVLGGEWKKMVELFRLFSFL